MDDPHDRLFQLTHMPPEAGGGQSTQSRKRWLRRMVVLLASSCLAFSLTALWLSHRASTRSSTQQADSQALQVVQAHFAALHRGDYRAAYALFSIRLRHEMTFQEFHQVMASHLPLLEGRVSISPETASPSRVVVDIAFPGTRRMGLTAEFTLVRTSGHWWIDDVHWYLQQSRPQRMSYA